MIRKRKCKGCEPNDGFVFGRVTSYGDLFIARFTQKDNEQVKVAIGGVDCA